MWEPAVRPSEIVEEIKAYSSILALLGCLRGTEMSWKGRKERGTMHEMVLDGKSPKFGVLRGLAALDEALPSGGKEGGSMRMTGCQFVVRFRNARLMKLTFWKRKR